MLYPKPYSIYLRGTMYYGHAGFFISTKCPLDIWPKRSRKSPRIGQSLPPDNPFRCMYPSYPKKKTRQERFEHRPCRSLFVCSRIDDLPAEEEDVEIPCFFDLCSPNDLGES